MRGLHHRGMSERRVLDRLHAPLDPPFARRQIRRRGVANALSPAWLTDVMTQDELIHALLQLRCHQRDIGDAFEEADPGWVMRQSEER